MKKFFFALLTIACMVSCSNQEKHDKAINDIVNAINDGATVALEYEKKTGDVAIDLNLSAEEIVATNDSISAAYSDHVTRSGNTTFFLHPIIKKIISENSNIELTEEDKSKINDAIISYYQYVRDLYPQPRLDVTNMLVDMLKAERDMMIEMVNEATTLNDLIESSNEVKNKIQKSRELDI